MRRLIFPLVLGLGGAAILIALCVWQVQRLAWKEALIADIAARLEAPAEELPSAPDPKADRYAPVVAEGVFLGNAIHVLTSTRAGGPGFRVIEPFETTSGRRILVDRGYIPEADKAATFATGPMAVEGNLLWPQEADWFTPAPNLERNIWFARDLGPMAEALGTEPILIAARAPTGDPAPEPLPVTVDLPNNHLQYAITWGLLALGWLAMTGYLVYRVRRDTT